MSQFLLFLALVASGSGGLGGHAAARDPHKIAKLEQLFKLTGLYDSIDEQRLASERQAEAMRPQMVEQLRKTFPDDNGVFWHRFDAAYGRFVTASQPSWTTREAVDDYAALYGAHLSEQDIDRILAFYRSPAGKKEIEASEAALPQWRALLQKKNEEAFQQHYQAFLQEVASIARESSPTTETHNDILGTSTAYARN